ncbi:tetratricopeptide repeat protein [Streptomyces sp. NPDC048629]|uniref:tetratricopeptide repeat protein n=1 Tax=Streptomyces sp. NPDC048629 TaxID=3154824 RepID=UPI0034341D46
MGLLDLFRGGAGSRSPRILEQRIRAAHALTGQGRHAEAEEGLRAVIRDARHLLGATHPVMVSARLALVATLHAAGRFTEAEDEARAVAATRTHLPDDALRVHVLGLAEMVRSLRGGHEEAVTVYAGLLPEMTRINGPEHLWTLQLRTNRASALAQLGRYEEAEAEALAVAACADRLRAPEATMPWLAASTVLVYALNGSGRHADAESVARGALAQAVRAASAPGVTRTLPVLGAALARALSGQGRHEEALAEVATARLYDTGAHAADTGLTGVAAARALHGLGREPEARAEAEQALESCTALFGPDHPRTVEARELLEAAGTR